MAEDLSEDTRSKAKSRGAKIRYRRASDVGIQALYTPEDLAGFDSRTSAQRLSCSFIQAIAFSKELIRVKSWT